MLKQGEQLKEGTKKEPYGLHMDRREHVSLTGVKDVVSFDETAVCLVTEGGEVTISGENLHVAKLMLEEGQLVIDGTIDALVYEDQKPKKKSARLIKRVFR